MHAGSLPFCGESMKHVLMVDRDKGLLEEVRSGLSQLSLPFSLLTASSTKEAEELMALGMVDLVVVAVEKETPEGFELLSRMTIRFPSIGATVLTSFPGASRQNEIRASGGFSILEKPVDPQQLVQGISDSLKQQEKGAFTTGIPLSWFLELMGLFEQTCLVEVGHKEKGKKGFFFFKEGELYDACIDEKTGEEAAEEMISWHTAEVRLKTSPTENIRRRIHTDLKSLIAKGEALLGMSDFPEKGKDWPVDAPGETHEAETPAVSVKEKTPAGLLEEIVSISDIQAAVLVTREGFVIESVGILEGINMEVVAGLMAMAMGGITVGQAASEATAFVGLTLEFKEALIRCLPVGNALLVIVVSGMCDSKRLDEIQSRIQPAISALDDLL